MSFKASLLLILVVLLETVVKGDPLPSWNATAAKAEIIRFVDSTTDPESEDYVPPAERIATFDNDGTLWSEQP
ncbi:MAG: haloacid dehalogenase-like hydrolase, partial [Puniceicoccales bacterium]